MFQSNAAPVWVEGIVYETNTGGGSSGSSSSTGTSSSSSSTGSSSTGSSNNPVKEVRISGKPDHFRIRGECIRLLSNMTDTWPWVTGYQKAIPIAYWDIWRYWYDIK